MLVDQLKVTRVEATDFGGSTFRLALAADGAGKGRTGLSFRDWCVGSRCDWLLQRVSFGMCDVSSHSPGRIHVTITKGTITPQIVPQMAPQDAPADSLVLPTSTPAL